jgi:hypothetical protein
VYTLPIFPSYGANLSTQQTAVFCNLVSQLIDWFGNVDILRSLSRSRFSDHYNDLVFTELFRDISLRNFMGEVARGEGQAIPKASKAQTHPPLDAHVEGLTILKKSSICV